MPKVKSAFLDFVRHVVNGDIDDVSRRLAASPSLSAAPAEVDLRYVAGKNSVVAQIAKFRAMRVNS